MRSLVAFVLGLVFIAFAALLGANAWNMVVKAAGVAVAIMGVVLLVNAFVAKRKTEGKTWTATTVWMLSSAIMSILVGIALFSFSAQISKIFALLVGVISLFVGLYQVVLLASTSKMVKVSPALFILPSIVAICGALVLLFWKKQNFDAVIGYMTGATLIIYAIADLVAQRRIQKILKSMAEAAAPTVEVEVVEEVETADEQ